MTIQNIADSITLTLNQANNHELKEAIKLDFKALLATRLRQTIEKNGIDLQYKVSHTDTLTLVADYPGCVSVTCMVLKGSKPVPKTIRYRSDNTYLFAGTVDGIPIPVGSKTEYKARKILKYNKNQPFIVIVNGYPYVYGTTKLGYIRFEDIFEDISQVNDICGSTNCLYDDTELTLPMDLFYELELEILKKYGTFKTNDTNEIEANKE